MRLGFLALFIAVPLIELALLIKIGAVIGVWPTIALVILTAVVGTTILRHQGLQTLQRLSDAMQSGEPPVGPVVDGVFLLMAGGFLLTPGILTDAVGFALLVPPVRRFIARWAVKQIFQHGTVRVRTFGMDSGSARSNQHDRDARPDSRRRNPKARPSRNADGPIIEGDFERMDDRPARTKDN
jgi:UPF0716 protein FxsA